MTAKEYLKQYENAVKYAERIQSEYNEQMEQIDNIRSSLGKDGMPSSGEVRKEVEEKAVKLAEKAQELKEAEIYAIEIRQQIFRTIMSVPGEMGSVLQERYINLMKWDDVADAVGYSLRQAHNIHREGLEAIQDMIDGKDCISLHTFI